MIVVKAGEPCLQKRLLNCPSCEGIGNRQMNEDAARLARPATGIGFGIG
jgi:hypothetical protein